MNRLLPFALVLLATAPRKIVPAPPDPAITHVSVLDIERGSWRRDRTVLIAGNHIVEVAPAAAVPLKGVARIIDGHEKFLIPGLWDMHVHLDSHDRRALGTFIAAGVTSIRDMGSPEAPVVAWRDSIVAGLLLGPRIRLAGTILESAKWRQAVLDLLPASAVSVRASLALRIGLRAFFDVYDALDSVQRLHGDFVKVRTEPDAVTFFTLLREARRRGLDVVGHPPTNVSLRDASDSGYRTIEHGFFGAPETQEGSELERLSPADRRGLFERFARNGTAITPTLIALHGRPDSEVVAFVARSRALGDASCISDSVGSDWLELLKVNKIGTPLDFGAQYRTLTSEIREMTTAGVPLLAGTDYGLPLELPGFSLLEELELLVRDGGLTTAAALRAATLEPAVVMHLADSLGTIQPGKVADLVLLDADPLVDIKNLRQLRAVFTGDRVMTRRELDELPGVAACGRETSARTE
ncbi:MAG TPA: amidohydrolase family protein [Gemmatimonadaceae bacterium]|jgi:cytosine/adenosine deaminase-related metal-dependent hydrolase